MEPRNLVSEVETWSSPHQVAVHLLQSRDRDYFHIPYSMLACTLYLYFIFSEGIAMGSHELHNSFKIPLSRTNGMAKNSCISLKNPQCSIYFLGPLGLLGKLLLFLSPVGKK